MGIVRAELSSISELATWLNANACPSIFKTVSYDIGESTLTATDADDHTVVTIKNGSGGGLTAYTSQNNSVNLSFSSIPNTSGTTISVIGCDNGLILETFVVSSSKRFFPFMFTKTNNGKVAVIFPSSFNSTDNVNYKTGLNHVAWGDADSFVTTTSFYPESGNQTCLTTWITNAAPGATSYTPNAFYMPAHSAYPSGMCKFSIDGDDSVYVTNGYWAVKVEEETS